MLLLGLIIFPLLSFTVMRFSSNPIPFGNNDGVIYMVNVAGISLNALPDTVDQLYTIKLIYPLSMIICCPRFCKKLCVPGSVKSIHDCNCIFPMLGISR
jgi:hypothetical protein